jgi:large subunit ribosomal protein L9
MATATPRQARRAKGFKRLPRGPHGGVELLLIQRVESLGAQGDVVEVKRGYAMNYLIPQGLATLATDHHKRMVEKHREKLLELEKARIAEVRKLATELSKQSVTIEANANEDGHLYGSVVAVDIAGALKKLNFQVTPEMVKLEGPLKELGLYTVKIQLHAEVDSEVKVWVVPTVGDKS